MSKIVVYSKHFPAPHEVFQASLKDLPPITTEQEKTAKELLKEMNRKLKYESRYVLREDRVKETFLFAQIAKHLSDDYELSLDIIKHHEHLEADFFISFGPHFRDFLENFIPLLSMCDEIEFHFSDDDALGFHLSLNFTTHDHYISDHLVN